MAIEEKKPKQAVTKSAWIFIRPSVKDKECYCLAKQCFCVCKWKEKCPAIAGHLTKSTFNLNGFGDFSTKPTPNCQKQN
jgi:transposase-like protein